MSRTDSTGQADDDDRTPATSSIVDLGLRQATGGAPATTGADGEGEQHVQPDHRRRTVLLALGVVAALVLAANMTPRGPAPTADGMPILSDASQPAEAASDVTPLDVCEAVAFANQTGGLPSKPTVLPPRAGGYFAFTDPANRATVIAGLTYLDGTVALCRPVAEPGDGSPAPGQPELPALLDSRTHAYEMGAAGLELIGERSPDGTITRTSSEE